MDAQEIAELRELMDYEGRRKGPPEGYPKFPDMPAGRYNSEEFYKLEKEEYWTKVWMMAGHMDEIPEVGSYKLWEMSGEPMLIVRGKDNVARAFYNTCSHRGAPVIQEAYGQATGGLACKYHGWTYDFEGKLINLRDKRDFVDLDMDCRGLFPVRTEQFGKLIFITLDDDAIPLREFLGPVASQWDDFDFANTRLVHHYTWNLECNWKIAMEANMEVYHVKSIHPDTVDAGLDYRKNVNTLYPHGHSRMVAPTPDAVLAAMPPKPDHIPEIESVGELPRTTTYSFHVDPNLVSPMGQTLFPMLFFWPDGLRKTKYELYWIGADWGEGEMPQEWKDQIDYFNVVITEDTQFGDWIQKSADSIAFKGVPLCYQESRIYHAHENIDRVIGLNKVPDHLAVKQVLGEDWIYPNDSKLRLEESERMKQAAE
ncbi:MAG: aromatic ring-hydroxylating oxygenase subunit alpha [Alphaproteobacteria bacterium]